METGILAATDAAELADDEIRRMRQVIAEYVAEVSSGEKFAALVALVPGLHLDGSTD